MQNSPFVPFKAFLACLLLLSAQAFGAPFLVSDPYVQASDPNMNPVQFVIHGLTATDVTVQATQLSNGTLVLQYDLATLPNGQYAVTAAAINIFGGESTFSAPPFAFTKGVPAPPSNLRISPTMLVWVPTSSLLPARKRPLPLLRPLAPSFS